MVKISDFKPALITVQVTMVYSEERDNMGKIVNRTERVEHPIVLRCLTRHEWEEIGFTVEEAAPPLKPDGKGERDWDSVRYRVAVLQAEHERNLRRLAHALAVNEKFFETSTLEEQANELKTLDAGIYEALFNQLQVTVKGYERKVETMAESFRATNGSRALQTDTRNHS